ncbi:MAG: hypothetical protein R3C68_00320 [Myxococcota bacterium]
MIAHGDQGVVFERLALQREAIEYFFVVGSIKQLDPLVGAFGPAGD